MSSWPKVFVFSFFRAATAEASAFRSDLRNHAFGACQVFNIELNSVKSFSLDKWNGF